MFYQKCQPRLKGWFVEKTKVQWRVIFSRHDSIYHIYHIILDIQYNTTYVLSRVLNSALQANYTALAIVPFLRPVAYFNRH